MAKNTKKISINQFESVVKERFPKTTTEQWFDVEVTITPTISLKEVLSFANDVVLSCFHDTNGFMPEMMDFAIRSNILSRYANFNLPDNLESRYDLLYRSDAVDFVCGHINMAQLQELISAINKKIDYMCQTNIKGIESKMQEIVESFEKMQGETEALFSGVTADDFGKLMGVFAQHGEIDEKKIVDALMENRKEADDVEHGGSE